MEAVLVQAADAISAARPGARREIAGELHQASGEAGRDRQLLRGRGEVLRHPVRPRDPHHGQARGRQRRGHDGAGQGDRQAHREGDGVSRTDQASTSSARPAAPNLPNSRGSAPAPHTASFGRRSARGKAAWLWSCRRSATGLAACGSGADSRCLYRKGQHERKFVLAFFYGEGA